MTLPLAVLETRFDKLFTYKDYSLIHFRQFIIKKIKVKIRMQAPLVPLETKFLQPYMS